MIKEELQKIVSGEVLKDEKILSDYSHDASLFKVKPELVIFPKDSKDIQSVTKYVSENKKNNSNLSVTVRAAGSCMSGGSLNESIILDVTKHMNSLGQIKAEGTIVEPGVFYRDFEKKTLEKSLILPCYTASKNMNALGGMVGNNCAGEKTLRYGKMENFLMESKVVFSDGNEYVVRPLSETELQTKINQNDFEGNVYKNLNNLIEENKEILEDARPKVSKNSAGYYLWNVKQNGIFDLNKLIVGSQGTLGIVTEAKVTLVPVEPVSKLFVIFLPNLVHLADLVNIILETKPESVESYDKATLKLAFRFFPEMLRTMKTKHFLKLMASFIPEAGMIVKEGGIPELIVLIEYSGKSEEEVNKKMEDLHGRLIPFKYEMRLTHSVEESDKYWTIRRESFNLLRKHVKNSRTAPFVDDVIVDPKFMPEFLPQMRKILDKYKLVYTIAGHAGNGNFHIIPLMDMRHKENIEIIKKVGEEVYDLVAKYKGSITAEHNDGIVRTPYLGKMFKSEVLELFKRTKEIFDPQNIFNPGKKVGGTIDYMCSHIAIE